MNIEEIQSICGAIPAVRYKWEHDLAFPSGCDIETLFRSEEVSYEIHLNA